MQFLLSLTCVLLVISTASARTKRRSDMRGGEEFRRGEEFRGVRFRGYFFPWNELIQKEAESEPAETPSEMINVWPPQPSFPALQTGQEGPPLRAIPVIQEAPQIESESLQGLPTPIWEFPQGLPPPIRELPQGLPPPIRELPQGLPPPIRESPLPRNRDDVVFLSLLVQLLLQQQQLQRQQQALRIHYDPNTQEIKKKKPHARITNW